MVKNIWLVRHAQSKSQTGETEDWLDPELSELGIKQAQRLAEPLSKLDLDLVLVSPMKRGWQTYEQAKIPAGKAEFDSRLIEGNWGAPDAYAGYVPEARPGILPDRQDAWMKETEQRCAELVDDVIAREEKNVLLVCHSGMLREVLSAFSSKKLDVHVLHATTENTAISLLSVDEEGNRYLRYWNDYGHVRDMLG